MVKSRKQQIKKSYKQLHKSYKKRNNNKTHKKKLQHNKIRKYTKKLHKKTNKKLKGGYGAGACPVGYSFKGKNIASWPGAAASVGANTHGMTMSNYYPLSPSGGSLMNLPISTRNSQFGGGRLTALVPQDLVNFGRSIKNSAIGLANSWEGQPSSISTNPFPTTQPIDKSYEYIGRKMPIDINKIHTQAGNKVANM